MNKLWKIEKITEIYEYVKTAIGTIMTRSSEDAGNFFCVWDYNFELHEAAKVLVKHEL